MSHAEVTIRQIIADISKCPADADAELDLYLELGLASTHAIFLLAELEDRLGIHIPDDQFVEARTISRLIALVTALGDSPNGTNV